MHISFLVLVFSLTHLGAVSALESFGGDIWISGSEKTTIEFKKEEFISVMTSYDYKYIIFMTLTEFEIYTIKEMTTPVKLASIKHGLENVEEEHLASFFTQQYICYLTSSVFYFFKLSDDKRRISFREEYPSNYFGVEKFTSVYTINLWRGVAFIKTGYLTVHFFDFTPVKKPKAVKLNLPRIGIKDIVQLKTFGLDLSVAVRYEDGFITIFDVVKQKQLKSFYYKGILYSNYDLLSNQYIVLLDNSTAKVIDCYRMKENAEIVMPIQLKKSKIYRTGTTLMALVQQSEINYYDMKSYTQVALLNVPEKESFIPS